MAVYARFEEAESNPIMGLYIGGKGCYMDGEV